VKPKTAGRNFAGPARSLAAADTPPDVKASLARREKELPAAMAMNLPMAMAQGGDTRPPHQVTNLDTFPHHFYPFELKRMDGQSIKSLAKYPNWPQP
jgi:hypothetical protein